jgi:thiamine-monophosphate kinase
MNEFELIRTLTAGLPGNDTVVVGPGDDCAVIESPGGGAQLLFKTDAVVEGIHFTMETEPEKVGHKALGRCLSDVAAMGGTATSALVTVGMPRDREVAWLKEVYRGMGELAARHGVAIVGGETTETNGPLFLSVAMLGEVPRGKAVLRRGARAGDAIFVSGELGGSLTGRHLEFEPRLREGRWLAETFDVHAMIDLSDGLASDLRHLLNAGGVGAELLAGSIPISRAARLQGRGESSKKPPLLAALTDGEDYELLFTVAPGDAVKVLDGWKRGFPDVPLTCVGRITEAKGVRIRDEHGVKNLEAHGYTHFK